MQPPIAALILEHENNEPHMISSQRDESEHGCLIRKRKAAELWEAIKVADA